MILVAAMFSPKPVNHFSSERIRSGEVIHLGKNPRDFGNGSTLALSCLAILPVDCPVQWIGLRENLQETMDFPSKYGGFL